MKQFLLTILLTVISFGIIHAQTENNIFHNWYNKSANTDQIYGAEVERTYADFLSDKKSTTVIVAVIDGGVDIGHEDLKNNIWINKNEIPNNGIDDDKNGYIDDINGWNFLGNKEGENISYENLEITRIYRQYKNKYDNIDVKLVPENEKEIFALFTEAKKLYNTQLAEEKKYEVEMIALEESYIISYQLIMDYLQTDTILISDLESINSDDKVFMLHVEFLHLMLSDDFDMNVINEMKEYTNEELNYHLNIDFNPRKEIIGDDINDILAPYGNNNVYGPEAFHGTFVAGIIAAQRNNGIGIDGIADNVKIMALKAVPNGDERDKDIAKAIRYAVDNGARIINMSFGKELSPQKYLVDDAIKYAEENGVLLVHAAGNDGNNIDKVNQYPTKKITQNYQAQNWIEVGASSMNLDLEFAANFTNYGMIVDLFAPGVNVKSLAPENEYDVADGTSFSCPVVSGVAALLMSYYPNLDAKEVKSILLKSATFYGNTKVYRPSDYSIRRKKVRFKKLSHTGGLVNAYEAVKLAQELSSK